jgi:hypothetical protein
MESNGQKVSPMKPTGRKGERTLNPSLDGMLGPLPRLVVHKSSHDPCQARNHPSFIECAPRPAPRETHRPATRAETKLSQKRRLLLSTSQPRPWLVDRRLVDLVDRRRVDLISGFNPADDASRQNADVSVARGQRCIGGLM